MSDLSRLLDDVYRSGTPAAEPAWSSDRALDDAFENWVPGPPAEAHEEERAYAQEWAEVAGNIPDAAVAFSEALADQEPAPRPDPFGPLHALLEEAIRLAPAPAPAADPDVEAVAPIEAEDLLPVDEPSPEPEPEPELQVIPAVAVADVVDIVEITPTFIAPAPVPGWTRSDDDILPIGRTGRGGKLLRRRR